MTVPDKFHKTTKTQNEAILAFIITLAALGMNMVNLPVYALRAAIVVIIFPPLFGFI